MKRGTITAFTIIVIVLAIISVLIGLSTGRSVAYRHYSDLINEVNEENEILRNRLEVTTINLEYVLGDKDECKNGRCNVGDLIEMNKELYEDHNYCEDKIFWNKICSNCSNCNKFSLIGWIGPPVY